MQKILYTLLLLCATAFVYAQDPAYPAIPAAPQNITAAESFIDTDPGVGKGTPIAISSAVNLSNLSAVINVTGLSNGAHRLYIRTRNAEGNWSITSVKEFLYDADVAYISAPPAAQNIVAAEYFIDTDPGFGAGTTIAITPGINLSNVSVSVNTAGLTNGTHRLYIRTKNNEGRWSMSLVKDFIVDFDFTYPAAPVAAQNIIAAEYFIDSDPGFGSGTVISITPGLNLSNVSVAVNTTGLTIGTHRLYIRTKSNEGRWNLTQVKDFIVDVDYSYPAAPVAAQNITSAEYFIDTDPGFGAGTAISITAGTNLSAVNASVNTTGLSIGVHRLYLRTKNAEGRWGLTQVSDFVVNSDYSYPVAPAAAQNITGAEYFIDTDPGFGNATAISITPGVDIANASVAVNTTGLSSGAHTLYLRTKNAEGKWSLVNKAVFNTSFIAVTPDTISFGSTPINIPIEKNVVVKNNSSTNQSITGITTHAPFSVNATVPVVIGAGLSDTLKVRFLPTAVGTYPDSVVLQTSAGNYTVQLNGSGIAQTTSWTIDPANGIAFGNVAVNATANGSLTLRNTGNIDIALSAVTFTDPAFTASYTAGTVVPVNGSINLPISFTPTAVAAYSTQIKVESSTSNAGALTTVLSGNGYSPGAPPVIQYVPAAPYSGTKGVNPAVGQTGLYTYKILYKSSNNRPPQLNYPKVGIDLNGDGDFNDIDEGTFNMVKEGSSTDYITGVVYSYTFNHTNNNNNAGYQFFATDDNGNAATGLNIGYVAGPIITSQTLDLRIFANDISFSKTNPLPGEAFTMTATVTNSTAVPATNVPVKFYRDTILMGSDVIPSVGAFSSATITRSLNFAAEGFYPIKVWIDSSNTLGESNILNNYAIRPIVVGSPNLPGGITVTTTASIQQCPQLKVLISGHAVYFGTGSPTAVAGAQVTINTGTQLINTTTDANGNYSYLLTGVPCNVTFAYTVSVTDFTFTSSLVTNSMAMPCPAPNACAVPVSQGGVSVAVNTSQCGNLVGSNANMNFTVKYRERDITNMWSLFDEIENDVLQIFKDGVLVETIPSADHSHAPGEVRVIPVSLPLSSTDPVNISAVLSYTYVEYRQIPDNFYKGLHIPMTATGGGTIQPALNLPDLVIQNFSQTSFGGFSFVDANVKCGPAGSHKVLIFDSIPGGASTLVQTTTVASLNGLQGITITYSDPNITPGTHIIKIVIDPDIDVDEQSKGNNVFIASVIVPKPDLTITKIEASQTALSIGSNVKFVATVKNTGKRSGAFKVSFMVNGVQLGAKKTVNFVAEKDSVYVSSDTYTVTTADSDCAIPVTASADVDFEVDELVENNNDAQMDFASDIAPVQLSNEVGSAGNPVVVRVNTSNQFYPAIRNFGQRDVSNVSVKYVLAGNVIGTGNIATVRAGVRYASFGSFTHTFTTPGDFTVTVTTDTANAICEINEGNNIGSFHIRVTDSKPDFEVLSQYISPSSLNPNAGQSITIVGTVKNMGGKPTAANKLRFLVDDIQLGNDVVINALQPGADTTVAATATYSSIISGVKVMKLVADPDNSLTEEREDNNEATRTMIVGEAPDMARSQAGAIRFNPGGFSKGDSVIVSYSIKNNGVRDGAAWVRFLIFDENNALTTIDSVPFTLAAGGNMVVSKKMLFSVDKGNVVAQIVRCTPDEFDFLNNDDTLAFSTVMKLKASTTVNANVDMKAALQDEVPGWIGGKLVLGDYDLIVNGVVTNFDTAHYVVTNGTGRLKFINSNVENTFPVSASLNSTNFVKINNTGTPDNFAVRVAPYVLKQGNGGDTIKAGYVNRTWFIEEDIAGGSNATVTFNWNTEDEQSGFDRAISRSAHYTSSWQLGDVGNAQTEANGQYSKTQAGYTSFSPFTVTSVNAALPLRLLQFTAAAKANSAELKWQTTNEVNTSHFVVQHSTDGLQFTEIGNVAAYNRSGNNNYSFVHAPIAEGLHYYRLKMVDIDGQFTYSDSRLIRIDANAVWKVYPNPAQRFVTVSGIEANGMINITTLDGKLLKQVITNSNTLLMDVSNLPGGVYILTYTNHGKMQQQKIIKQ
ncbi:MAG: CARDB domain-containing protein [Chitinophagaceae bacterium]